MDADIKERECHIDTYVGRRLRERRQKLKLTLAAVARKVNVSHQQIQKYEQGDTRVSAGMMYQLSKLLGVTPNYFFEGYTGNIPGGLTANNEELISLKRTRPIRIMIVEDDPADEMLTRKAIEKSEAASEVYAVHDGIKALEWLRAPEGIRKVPRPDIILMDLYLPKKDGFYTLKDIKRDATLHDIPVIILTNNVNKKEMINIYKAGASGYISKSLEVEQFNRCVTTALEYWAKAVILPNMN